MGLKHGTIDEVHELKTTLMHSKDGTTYQVWNQLSQ
jgi:hypothetical protein